MARTMRFGPINPPFEEVEETSGAKIRTVVLLLDAIIATAWCAAQYGCEKVCRLAAGDGQYAVEQTINRRLQASRKGFICNAQSTGPALPNAPAPRQQ